MIARPVEQTIAFHAGIAAKRCVRCGEIVDSLILLNRQFSEEPITVERVGKILSNHCVTEGLC
ncbi:MAG: hypothetical protein E8D49_14055 [Nitrospira sp.]|jgi:hypothetical protein|nr:MAG: hypothetical protein E8D49_14055 [Nitrospira sp.]